jgi:hypothetical protein
MRCGPAWGPSPGAAPTSPPTRRCSAQEYPVHEGAAHERAAVPESDGVRGPDGRSPGRCSPRSGFATRRQGGSGAAVTFLERLPGSAPKKRTRLLTARGSGSSAQSASPTTQAIGLTGILGRLSAALRHVDEGSHGRARPAHRRVPALPFLLGAVMKAAGARCPRTLTPGRAACSRTSPVGRPRTACRSGPNPISALDAAHAGALVAAAR